jgi:DNA-3-methyladenine glycosylase II
VKERASFVLEPCRPYALRATAERLVRFDDLLERFDAEEGVLRRALRVGRRLVLVGVAQEGPPSRALLRVSIRGAGAGRSDARSCAVAYVSRALGATQPVNAFYRAFRRDPLLGPPIRTFQGLRVAGSAEVFESLVTTILSQQINLGFAYSIRRELVQGFGRSARFDGERYWVFPSPRRLAAVSMEELRALRISRAKARAIGCAARAFRGGALSDRGLDLLSDDAVVEALSALDGVGRWTAEVVLMRGLGRVDVFPGADLGVIKYLAQQLLGRSEVATEREMREFAEGWRPYRALALAYAYAEMRERRQLAHAGAATR